jgi:penicillin-binding protein 1B
VGSEFSVRAVFHRIRHFVVALWRRRWVRIAAVGLGIPSVLLLFVLGYYYATFARIVDEKLHVERVRTVPRVHARPLVLRPGQALSERQLVDRLNDLGYTQQSTVERPAQFALDRGSVFISPRAGKAAGQMVKVVFKAPPPRRERAAAPVAPGIERIELGRRTVTEVELEAPLLTALFTSSREKRRAVSLAAIPKRVVQAILAIEDRRFYAHPGVDIIRIIGAVITNLRGNRPYLVGASTITQQLVKNFFLTPEKSYTRKLQEQFLAIVLERRASKDEILELYLNEVYLGHRGSFAIHGVAEAARLFFGKDVTNLTLSEAATIAGVIQAPPSLSPFTFPTRCRDRRNLVLQAMADEGYVPLEAAERAGREPLTVVGRAIEAEAPYFVDMVSDTLAEQFPGLTASPQTIDVYTTLDLNLQRMAQDAVRDGLLQVDDLLAKRRRKPPPAQGALIAIDPGSGDILALVGGRSYNQSQFNRVTTARRQPGSVFKPFVYLAAFEQAHEAGRSDMTPATLVLDEPTTFSYEDKVWEPANYENEYDGLITLRHALAHSRNIATIKVAEVTGFDHVAALWRKFDVATPARAYPSIALGVFETSLYEMAAAYTVFPNLGRRRVPRSLSRITVDGKDLNVPVEAPKEVAHADTTFLVLNMLRSVVNEGTGAGARAAGFALDAAGKTGTTNDLRDAWFVGFTPELLTVTWVGFDDNRALGLSGAQAALPIWTRFMTSALAGHPDTPFEAPEGVTFVEIDRDTGKIAQPGCPRVLREAFLPGSEPTEACLLHKF